MIGVANLMRGHKVAAAPTVPVSYVRWASQPGSDGGMTITGIQPGDLIVLFVYRPGSTTIVNLQSGWTDVASISGSTNSGRVASRIATSTSLATGNWGNVSRQHALVFRNAAVGASNATHGFGFNLTLPSVTLQVNNGSSWVAAFAGSRFGLDQIGEASGMTRRGASTFFGGVSGSHAGYETGAGVTSFASRTVSTGNDGWVGFSIEIRAAA